MPVSTPTPVVIIDGAVPRTEQEVCRSLLDYAELLYDPAKHSGASQGSLGVRLDLLKQEVSEREQNPGGPFLYWGEIADNIIQLIGEMLPDNLTVRVGEHTPGDVVISERFSEGDRVKFTVEVPVTTTQAIEKTGKITHITYEGNLVIKEDNDPSPGHHILSPSEVEEL